MNLSNQILCRKPNSHTAISWLSRFQAQRFIWFRPRFACISDIVLDAKLRAKRQSFWCKKIVQETRICLSKRALVPYTLMQCVCVCVLCGGSGGVSAAGSSKYIILDVRWMCKKGSRILSVMTSRSQQLLSLFSGWRALERHKYLELRLTSKEPPSPLAHSSL